MRLRSSKMRVFSGDRNIFRVKYPWLYISKFTRLRAVSRLQHGSCLRFYDGVYILPGSDLTCHHNMAAEKKKKSLESSFAEGSIKRLYLENFVYVIFCVFAGIPAVGNMTIAAGGY